VFAGGSAVAGAVGAEDAVAAGAVTGGAETGVLCEALFGWIDVVAGGAEMEVGGGAEAGGGYEDRPRGGVVEGG
jgi:hypothetical protein